jgi:hypothetical protein
MPKGRPGGNPDLAKYHFKQKYDWDEPCNSLINLKVPASMKLALQEINNWQEMVRQVIAAELEKTKQKNLTIASRESK